MAINSHRHTERKVCEKACIITPHFPICLCNYTHLSSSSFSCSITVISSGNMAIFWLIKCQIEPQTFQATRPCAPLLSKTQHTPVPLRIAITEKEGSETRVLGVLVVITYILRYSWIHHQWCNLGSSSVLDLSTITHFAQATQPGWSKWTSHPQIPRLHRLVSGCLLCSLFGVLDGFLLGSPVMPRSLRAL